MKECRVQSARRRKGMPFHPCKPVGCIEYSGFARTIDDRIECRCLSCYPEVTGRELLLQVGVHAEARRRSGALAACAPQGRRA